MEDISQNVYGKLKKQYENLFCEEFLKTKKFDDVIYDVLKNAEMYYIISALLFQLVFEISENVRYTPAIYDNYSVHDKKKINTFLKNIKVIINNFNFVIKEMNNSIDLIKK